MKLILLILMMFWISVACTEPEDDLILIIDTGSITEFKISYFQNLNFPDPNYNIDCNDDGTFEGIAISDIFICDYSASGAGTYQIRIQDNSAQKTGLSAPIFGNQNIQLLTIKQWGYMYYYSLMRTFRNINILVDTKDIPDFSRLISTQSAMSGASGEVYSGSDLNFSSVTDMSSMFLISDVDIDTSFWDVSSVESMYNMFYGAISIPDISNWNVSSVKSMISTFENATSDIPDISNWDVSSVQSMWSMFERTQFANPNVSFWNVSAVNSFEDMFRDADLAEPDVSGWDVSNSLYFYGMFRETALANPDVSKWDLSSALVIDNMFQRTEVADPDVSQWNVSNVLTFRGLFSYSKMADPDVSAWDLSGADDIDLMFDHAEVANPDVSNWDVSSVRSMYGTFKDSVAKPDVSNWDVSSVYDMRYLFSNAELANPDVGLWDFSSNPYLLRMFNNSGIQYHNYDRALRALYLTHNGLNENLSNVPSNYCRSEFERNELVNKRGWSISDLGKDCSEALTECIFSDGVDVDSSKFRCGISLD